MPMPGNVGGGLSFQQALAIVQSNPEQFAGMDPAAAAMQLIAAGPQPPPQPVEINEDTPAPVQPGVPIESPPIQPPPVMATDYRAQDALKAAIAAGAPKSPDELTGSEGADEMAGGAGKDTLKPAAPAAPAKLSPAESFQKALSDAQLAGDIRRGFEKPAPISSDLEKLLANREARYTKEGEEADADRKQQMWMAVMMAGAKMAQSQSPYFASALGAGLEAGALGLNKAKADAAERKARLLDKKEQTVIDRVTAQNAADQKRSAERKESREEAISNVTGGQNYEKNQMQIDLIPKQFALEEKKVQADIAQSYASIENMRKNNPELEFRLKANTALLNQSDELGDLATKAFAAGDEATAADLLRKRASLAHEAKAGIASLLGPPPGAVRPKK